MQDACQVMLHTPTMHPSSCCCVPIGLGASVATCHAGMFTIIMSSSCHAGMFTVITSLAMIDKLSPAKAEKLVRWFDPAILWIQRWLGAFYVPAMAVLPITIQGIEGRLSWPQAVQDTLHIMPVACTVTMPVTTCNMSCSITVYCEQKIEVELK